MVSKARMGCDNPATSLTYWVHMQRKSGSTWSDYKPVVTGTLYGSQTVSSPSKPIVRQVVATCARGTYRTAAQIRATSGGQTKTGAIGYSQTVVDPCVTGGGGGGGGSW